MRALTSGVLVMQAIMLGLAIPVVLVAGGQPAAVGWLLAVLAVAALLLPAAARRSWYLPAGWAVQVATVACGVFEPMLFFLGAVFAALWWTAIRLGSRAEGPRTAG